MRKKKGEKKKKNNLIYTIQSYSLLDRGELISERTTITLNTNCKYYHEHPTKYGVDCYDLNRICD